MALVGQNLKGLGIGAGVDHKFPVGIGGIANSDTCLRSLGYCLELALRPGVQHSGLCAIKIMQEISTRNPRSTPVQATAAQRVLGTNFLVYALAAMAMNILRMTQHAYRLLTPQRQTSTAWRRAWRLGGAHVQARGGRPRS